MTSSTADARVEARAPGRVNLIGEHTDYTGGLALPMAIQLETAIHCRPLDGRIILRSEQLEGVLDISLPVTEPVAELQPAWGAYVAAVAAETGATKGFEGLVTSTVPLGSGLSSSAALEVATAVALRAVQQAGDDQSRTSFDITFDPRDVAEVCQRAEHLASGVPCGIMDQLISAGAVAGHATRLDCETLSMTPVPIPTGAQIVVVHSGEHRGLRTSAYGERREQCEAAERIIGPLRRADVSSLEQIADEVVRARARHVITENARVDAFALALSIGALGEAGAIMLASHASLRDDFAVSTDVLDALVEELMSIAGVHGARLTGAGFGGCVVALTDPGVQAIPSRCEGWVVTASRGASATVRLGAAPPSAR